MAQEEQNQRCSNSSSGGGISCKKQKQKQKKIPQRGLGVAQLEKIRLEEQQKKNPSLSSSTSSPSCQSLPLPNYHHHNQSCPFPPPPPLPLTELSLPNSLFRPVHSVPSVDTLHSNTVPLPSPTNAGGSDIGWQYAPVPVYGNISKLWDSDNSIEGENSRVDPGLAFLANSPCELNPIWSLPNVMQRTQQYQQPCYSMVNVSPTTSSSSVLNFQMEPPSNQSYYSNYSPIWPEEDKMVGSKRPYPFSIENTPWPSFHGKIPAFVVPITRSDESTSCGNGGTRIFDPSTKIFRDVPLCSTSMSEQNSKDGIRENGAVTEDFLTLAPPTATPPYPISKFKHSSAYPNVYDHEQPEFERFPYRGTVEDPISWQQLGGLIHQHQPFYSFFPPAKAQIGQSKIIVKSCNGAGENVDLDLKL